MTFRRISFNIFWTVIEKYATSGDTEARGEKTEFIVGFVLLVGLVDDEKNVEYHPPAPSNQHSRSYLPFSAQ